MNNELENILSNIQQKEASVLCREVISIGDTMDVLRAKWNVEILTAILCGQTRFKDILSSVKGISEKVLSDRLRQPTDDLLIEKQECYGYIKNKTVEQLRKLKDIGVNEISLGVERGEFSPLTEQELMQELLTFLELLTCDCALNTHHTSSMNLTGSDFLKRKPQILEALRYGIEHFDMDELTNIRQNKRTL